MELMNYNNLNAQEIANRIIASEEEYLNIDYEALSFEDKCHYVLGYSAILHPGLDDTSARRKEMVEGLRPELLRRAEKEDGLALYVLGFFKFDCAPSDAGEGKTYLERSFKAGYIPAVITLVSKFYRKKEDRLKAVDEYLFPALNRLTEEKKTDTSTYFSVVSLLSDLMPDATAGFVFYSMRREYAAKKVCEGSYRDLMYLCLHHFKRPCALKVDVSEDELTFWQTVEYLVHLAFYNKGCTRMSGCLVTNQLKERGCVRDEELLRRLQEDYAIRCEALKQQLNKETKQ